MKDPPHQSPSSPKGTEGGQPPSETAKPGESAGPPPQPPLGPCAKNRRHGRLTAEEIIAAAAVSFYKNGYADTTLATVARQLNVTDKAIYYYFKSKDLLYLMTVNACMDWVTAIIEEIDARDISGLDKIKTFARRVIRNSLKRRRYLRSLPEHLEDTDLGRRYKAIERAQEESLIGWVREGIADGSIRPDDPKMLWKWNQGGLIWLDAWAREGMQYDDDDLERAAMTMLNRSLGRTPNQAGGE